MRIQSQKSTHAGSGRFGSSGPYTARVNHGIRMTVCVLAAMAAGGCSWFGGDGRQGGASTVPRDISGTDAESPFAPVSLRVHPLTRVVVTGGKPEIIVHVELRDAWGDSAKGTGAMALRLFGPAGGLSGGANQALQRWDIDLSNLDTNAAMFDPATRTYRVQLTGGPEWLSELQTAKSRPRVVLQATLTPGEGRPPLSDEYIVAP